MTAKQFKLIRKTLGLSATAMGRALGQADGRQVRYYESGDRPLPETVARLMFMFKQHGIPKGWDT